MKVFHTSNSLFDFPSFEIADTVHDKSGKAYLGFYVGMNLDIVKNLKCEYVYEIDLHLEDADTRQMDLSQMIKLYNWIGYNTEPVEVWISMRHAYQALGIKFVNIVEANNLIGESVIIDLSCIKQFKLLKD